MPYEVDYTKWPAKPTPYGGIMMRSRLEATWAAMFDELGVPWDYETERLDGWVPDFTIEIRCATAGCRKSPHRVLCEVKPHIQLDQFKTHASWDYAKSSKTFGVALLGTSAGNSWWFLPHAKQNTPQELTKLFRLTLKGGTAGERRSYSNRCWIRAQSKIRLIAERDSELGIKRRSPSRPWKEAEKVLEDHWYRL